MTAGVTLPTERSTATPRIGAGDHALQAGPMRASVRAQAGGRIASLWREEQDGTRTDVLVPMQDLPFNPDQWQKAGCYPLAPWSNRIRDASFPFGGETIQLPAHPSCAPHTVHGFSHARAWSVTSHDDASLEMRYRHQPDAWPWAFEAVQLVTLDETGLTVEISVRNRSDRAMPAGFGVHPFFKADHGDVVRFTCDTAWRSDAAGCGTHAEALAPAQASHEVADRAKPGHRLFRRVSTASRPSRGRTARASSSRPARRSTISCSTCRRAAPMPASSRSATSPTRSTWRRAASRERG